jgi:hypothetical protein
MLERCATNRGKGWIVLRLHAGKADEQKRQLATTQRAVNDTTQLTTSTQNNTCRITQHDICEACYLEANSRNAAISSTAPFFLDLDSCPRTMMKGRPYSSNTSDIDQF